jgi:NADH-quinone oxidoreductase subunit N
VVILIENRLNSVDVDDYAGLGRRAPFLAAALTIFLFSLIGVPPTAGFMGKFHLIMGVLDVGETRYYVLAVAAMLNSALSAYYYLKVAKTMYFVKSRHVGPLSSPALGRVLVAALVILTFYLCLQADALLRHTVNLEMHV